jgi:hypothetical protein
LFIFDLLSSVCLGLQHHDPGLLQHLREQGFAFDEYFWPILRTLMTELLSKTGIKRFFSCFTTDNADDSSLNFQNVLSFH